MCDFYNGIEFELENSFVASSIDGGGGKRQLVWDRQHICTPYPEGVAKL